MGLTIFLDNYSHTTVNFEAMIRRSPNTEKTAQFVARQLELMPLNADYTFNPAEVQYFEEGWLRTRVSQLNQKHKINLRMHKYKDDGRMQIWHDPTPFEKVNRTSLTFDRLVELKRIHASLAERARSGEVFEVVGKLVQIQDEIDRCIEELKKSIKANPVAPKGGRIKQSLEAVLAWLKITPEEWKLIPGKEQMRQWVKAEVEMRNQIREVERENEKKTEGEEWRITQ